VDFLWYAKKASLAAGTGYAAGIVAYLGQTFILNHMSM
jgi:hypothetical protein